MDLPRIDPTCSDPNCGCRSWPYNDASQDPEGANMGPVITPEGVTFHPWQRESAVGFRIEYPSGNVSYIYLNPSSDDSEGLANVFVYLGTEGDPAIDQPLHWYGLEDPPQP